ncbi:MAG: replication-relaxation family protein [Mycobacteriales bacterium]
MTSSAGLGVGKPGKASAGPAGGEGAPDSARRGSRDRYRGGDDLLLSLAGRLTERDRILCRLLASHRVLTTDQVADVAFTGVRRAAQRLAELHSFTVLDRFRPRAWAGSAPYHWLLGPAGAALLAAEAGEAVAALRWRRDTATALARSQRLAHLVGVNATFTALIRTARTHPGCELATWWSEARCAAEWGELVRPDGYGVWASGGRRAPFLLEYDTGSERLARLGAKLPGYADLAVAVGHPTWVCFRFPTPGREAAARGVLTHPGVPVATAVLGPRADPSGPVWLPVTRSAGPSGGRRLALGELGDPRRALAAPATW